MTDRRCSGTRWRRAVAVAVCIFSWPRENRKKGFLPKLLRGLRVANGAA
jgi:hypothetical protein